jgi:hypothetical protein
VSAEDKVRAAFAAQARHCEQLGSPFTALLCATLARRLTRATPVGNAILDWEGDPDPHSDSLPLRVAGALHALARARGRAPELAALYPVSGAPNGPAGGAARSVVLPDEEALYRAIELTFRRRAPDVLLFLRRAPQSNEAGRSLLLVAGLLTLARRLQKPIVLHELGASAGLNLAADRYRHRFGSSWWGPLDAALTLMPEWHGPPPPIDAPLKIASRAGCDIAPIDLRGVADRERLAAYIWPDQPERQVRLDAALETLATDPPEVEHADAQRWLELKFIEPQPAGTLHVIWHSIFWNYLDVRVRARLEKLMATAATRATAAQPLAWLRYELEPRSAGLAADAGVDALLGAQAVLRLDLWPRGESIVLAEGHPHGSEVYWRGWS